MLQDIADEFIISIQTYLCIKFGRLEMYYYKYHSLYSRPHCDTINNVCLDHHNFRYVRFHYLQNMNIG